MRGAATVPVSGRLPIVYALLGQHEGRQLGKTVQGYGRPFGDHNNDVMPRVRDSIREPLREGLGDAVASPRHG